MSVILHDKLWLLDTFNKTLKSSSHECVHVCIRLYLTVLLQYSCELYYYLAAAEGSIRMKAACEIVESKVCLSCLAVYYTGGQKQKSGFIGV